MLPYGGTPRCPRCEKAVYMAEQVMGPGRKLYHKPCLTCASCNKRLDSYNLVEHDEEPYCKNCHVRNFGTRDLRSANLPNRERALPASLPSTPRKPSDPDRAAPATAPRLNSASTGSSAPSFWSRASADTPPIDGDADSPTAPAPVPTDADEADESRDTVPLPAPSTPPPARALTSTYTGTPLSPTSGSFSTVGRTGALSPLVPTATGTRYGRLLDPSSPSSSSPASSPEVKTHSTGPARWGGGTGVGGAAPRCARCDKTCYHAEQVRAVGRTFHRACLRCTVCAVPLAPGRLAEREGEPFCHRCYSKVHGPQGGGYALLGKAGA